MELYLPSLRYLKGVHRDNFTVSVRTPQRSVCGLDNFKKSFCLIISKIFETNIRNRIRNPRLYTWPLFEASLRLRRFSSTPPASKHFLIYVPLFSVLMSVGWLHLSTQTHTHSFISYGNTIFDLRLFY